MPATLETHQGPIAYHRQAGGAYTVIFCPGFNSSMHGNKALALGDYCAKLGLEYIRFDYRGTGDSAGDFADGSITAWLHDTVSIIDQLASHKVILVGSSMGGWLSLLAALKRPTMVKGVLLIACAADMTTYYSQKTARLPAQEDSFGRRYYWGSHTVDNEQPYRIYQSLLDDGTQYTLLNEPIELSMPIGVLHGKKDDVVPWQRSQEVIDQLCSTDINAQWVSDGDHRLSRPQDLELMTTALDDLLSSAKANA